MRASIIRLAALSLGVSFLAVLSASIWRWPRDFSGIPEELRSATVREERTTPARTAARQAPRDDNGHGEDTASARRSIHRLQVDFPDGSSITVSWRQADPPPPPLPPSDRLIDQYDDLRRLAEQGHGAAARTLYRALRSCRRAFETESSLNAALQRLRNERVLTTAGEPRVMPLPAGARVADFEEDLRRSYAYCSGVTAGMREEAARWAELAARAGDYLGLQDWAAELGRTAAGLRAWTDAWERGLASALAPLALLHASGVSEPDGRPPDHVLAYAYTLLELQITQAVVNQLSGADRLAPTARRNRIIALQDTLRYRAGFLSPQETEAAIALARELLSKNPNCCTGSA